MAITISADKMENKELEKWLEETKAKNLSQWELQNEIDLIMDKGFLMQLKGSNNYTKASILFNQWQKEAEFSPKRGDRVLVYNENENKAEEAIFFEKDKERILVFDDKSEYEDYLKDITGASRFIINQFKHMKPLPTKQPKETDFKSQVIELIENEIEKCQKREDENSKNKNYYHALIFRNDKITYKDVLEKIKQLC